MWHEVSEKRSAQFKSQAVRFNSSCLRVRMLSQKVGRRSCGGESLLCRRKDWKRWDGRDEMIRYHCRILISQSTQPRTRHHWKSLRCPILIQLFPLAVALKTDQDPTHTSTSTLPLQLLPPFSISITSNLIPATTSVPPPMITRAEPLAWGASPYEISMGRGWRRVRLSSRVGWVGWVKPEIM